MRAIPPVAMDQFLPKKGLTDNGLGQGSQTLFTWGAARGRV